MSIKAVLFLFAWWEQHRRAANDKVFAASVFSVFLKTTTPGDNVENALGEKPWACEQALCQIGLVVDGNCACVSRVGASAWCDRGGRTPQEMCATLVRLLLRSLHCACCLAFARRVITLLVDHVEGNADQWGDTDLLEASGMLAAGCQWRQATPSRSAFEVADSDGW